MCTVGIQNKPNQANYKKQTSFLVQLFYNKIKNRHRKLFYI